jgi:hypothetical protein
MCERIAWTDWQPNQTPARRCASASLGCYVSRATDVTLTLRCDRAVGERIAWSHCGKAMWERTASMTGTGYQNRTLPMLTTDRPATRCASASLGRTGSRTRLLRDDVRAHRLEATHSTPARRCASASLGCYVSRATDVNGHADIAMRQSGGGAHRLVAHMFIVYCT